MLKSSLWFPRKQWQIFQIQQLCIHTQCSVILACHWWYKLFIHWWMKGIYFASFYFRVWDLTREIRENKNPAKISPITSFIQWSITTFGRDIFYISHNPQFALFFKILSMSVAYMQMSWKFSPMGGGSFGFSWFFFPKASHPAFSWQGLNISSPLHQNFREENPVMIIICKIIANKFLKR